MQRTTLRDFRLSHAPKDLGICAENLPACADTVNTAQRRLLYDEAFGDEGPIGTFAEVQFNGVSASTPYITLGRDMARIDALAVCTQARRTHNQLYEYLQFGNGRLPKACGYPRGPIDAYQRNNAVTQVDLFNVPQMLRIYSSDASDAAAGLSIMFQGTDKNNMPVLTTDANSNLIQGELVTFGTPFAQSLYQWNKITGIQKDQTHGMVTVYQVDPITAAESLLLTMFPTETTAWYPRYYLNALPSHCRGCGPASALQVTAIVKLELIPAVSDLDYLLIPNLEAIYEEAQAFRLSKVDTPSAAKQSEFHHLQAVKLLNGEIRHVLGVDNPAIRVSLFGSNPLRPSFR